MPLSAQISFTLDKTVDISGTITNQDGEPVTNAHIVAYHNGNEVLLFETYPDMLGQYSILFDYDGWGCWCEVTSGGYPKYKVNPPVIDEKPIKEDIVLYNKIAFHADQMSTIVTPIVPDTNWGKFYKLSDLDGQNVIFERELHPQANTPYVLFPYDDFCIDISGYDFSQEIQPVTIVDTFLYENKQYILKAKLDGSYESCMIRVLYEIEKAVLLDSTPDCKNLAYYMGRGQRIGACRAWLKLTLVFAPNYVFIDTPEGIYDIANESQPTFSNSNCIFNLQGRRLAGPPAKGVYIRDGKKVVR